MKTEDLHVLKTALEENYFEVELHLTGKKHRAKITTKASGRGYTARQSPLDKVEKRREDSFAKTDFLYRARVIAKTGLTNQPDIDLSTFAESAGDALQNLKDYLLPLK